MVDIFSYFRRRGAPKADAAVFTGRRWVEEEPRVEFDTRRPSLFTLTLLSIFVLYVQLLLGAMFRHKGLSWWPHVIHAAVVAIVLSWTAVRAISVYSHVEAVKRPAILMLGLMVGQLCLGFLAFFNFEITLNVIAALLTLVGYSVNDTIVIFDRVRENLGHRRKEPLSKVLNDSMNQTLTRTLISNGTTFLSVLGLYLFGGEVLRGFGFTMVVGILIGTYSTLFIAVPFVSWWYGRKGGTGGTEAVTAAAKAPAAKPASKAKATA